MRFLFFIIVLLNSTINLYSQQSNSAKHSDVMLADKPADFPKITIHVNDNPAPGYLLLNSFNQNIFSPKYIMLVDSLGEPVKYRKSLLAPVLDFKLQQNGLYSFAQAIAPGETHTIGGKTVRNAKTINYILDTAFKLIDSVQCKNGYLSDPHEFLILPNGNYLLLSYESFPVDMSSISPGGNPNTTVIGTVIQELDHNRNCVFQWRSLDNLPVTHTYANITNPTFEHVHGNSYFPDTDGNLMTSFTASFDIVKLNMVSGEILWHFGGKRNNFEISGDDDNLPFHFSNQHDIKRLSNGNFLFYDNGFAKTPQYSRAVEFSVNELERKANLVWQFRRNPDVSAFAMGSAQRLSNGNTLINWGMLFSGEHRAVTEVTPGNNVAYEISLPAETYCYRAFKYEYPVCSAIADVTITEAVTGNTYKFTDDNQDTGAELLINSIDAFMYNYMTLVKYECGAQNVSFSGEAPVVLPGRFVFKTKMVYSFSGDLSFDVSTLPTRYNYSKVKFYHRKKVGEGDFSEVGTTYDALYNKLIASISDTGEYIIGFERSSSTLRQPALVMPFNKTRILNGNPVVLVWSPNGRFDDFTLQVAKDEGFGDLIFNQSDIKNTSQLLALENNNTYFWRVKTNYRDIESNWSETRELIVSDSILIIEYPQKTDSLFVDSIAIFRWTTNLSDSLQLLIYKDGQLLGVIKDSLYSYFNAYAWKVPKTLATGDDYTISIASIKNKNNKLMSEEFKIINKTTAVEDLISESESLSISPNPASDYIEINDVIPVEAGIQVRILDILGIEQSTPSVLRTATPQEGNLRIDVSSLPPGVYFVRVGNEVRKFIKM